MYSWLRLLRAVDLHLLIQRACCAPFGLRAGTHTHMQAYNISAMTGRWHTREKCVRTLFISMSFGACEHGSRSQ